MPRKQTYTKTIALSDGALLTGRSVKTCSYSEKLVEIIKSSGCSIAEKDIRGWCSLNYVIQAVNKNERTVLLKYTIPNTTHQCVSITWPMDGLSKSSGIRI